MLGRPRRHVDRGQDSRVAAVADEGDSRTVLQAHKLRRRSASAALVLGGAEARGRVMSLVPILVSVVLALVILGGIVVAGNIIDLVSARM